MTKGKVRRGVSKADWLEAGLQFLGEGSVADVTVEGLAKSLGIAKAGFYWHFDNRGELLQQLLEYWAHEITEVVTENPEVRALEPTARLRKTAEMIMDFDLVSYEIAIRQWALKDKQAARAVRKVDRKRLDFVREALAEIGFDGDEKEMRAMLFVCYHTWEGPMFRQISRKRRRQLVGKRIELLTSR